MSDDERKENQLEDIAQEMSADLAAEKRAESVVLTCRYCGYVSETGGHCTTPGCPGNVAAGLFPFP